MMDFGFSDNAAARDLYASLGFRPTEAVEGDEVVAWLPAEEAGVTG
ncbi:hypothetical protein ACFXKG_32375 [Streptomyces sp. NPDC059255]